MSPYLKLLFIDYNNYIAFKSLVHEIVPKKN